MGRQIIKQPNGKYCIFSSVVDNVVYYNHTAEEIIEIFLEKVRQEVVKMLEKIEKKECPYGQFTLSYEDMIETIKDLHGEDEGKKVQAFIEKI